MEKVKKSRQKKSKWLQDLKKDKPCMDCGKVLIPQAMQWDHREPSTKKFCISETLQNNISRKRILEEIEKCDLVCANCHAYRTYGAVV